MDEKHLQRLRRMAEEKLVPWFTENRRDLPWRRRRTPYRALVAEVMLQQTRVDQVLPYYRRFLRAFPSARALASAPEQRVLKAWEGLGYYRRARNLQRAARVVVEGGGRFPKGYAAWRALPGVGAYTAAALASLIDGEPVAVVDGNVVRVLTRLMAADGNPRTAPMAGRLRAAAGALLVPDQPGAYNEAMMELGALVCTPRHPACGACPLHTACRARAGGDPARYPGKASRKALPHKVVGAAVIRNRRGEILIARRREEGLLGGLWEFPGGKQEPGETMAACIRRELQEEMGLDLNVEDPLIVVRHAYSHFTIELHAYRARIRRGRPRCLHCAGYAWVRPEAMDRYPFSRADLQIVEALRRALQAECSTRKDMKYPSSS